MQNIRYIILDTTYILPLFGIEVDLTPDFNKTIKRIWSSGLKEFEFYLPSVCLIEVLFKLLGEYRKNKEFGILERYYISLPTIIKSPVKVFDSELSPEVSLIAIKIRHSGHSDMMDCWIAATAAALNGILLTEDKTLRDSLENTSETKTLQIWTWKDMIQKISAK